MKRVRVGVGQGLGLVASGGRGGSKLGRRDGSMRWRKREKSEGRMGEVKSVRREELETERNGKGREKEKRKENKLVK